MPTPLAPDAEDFLPRMEVDAVVDLGEITDQAVQEVWRWRPSATAIRRRYWPRWMWKWPAPPVS
jgi:hypothetical protein